jgi:hypothetical protein
MSYVYKQVIYTCLIIYVDLWFLQRWLWKCDGKQCGRNLPTFRMNVLAQSSESKTEPNKEQQERAAHGEPGSDPDDWNMYLYPVVCVIHFM